MNYKVENVKSIKGELSLPGDKSISHRSVMFSCLAGGESTIQNCLMSEDLISTMSCFRALGCRIDEKDELVIINGAGFNGFKKPVKDLHCGNSGTTARLITGILAAQSFSSKLIGDESLSQRPMRRVVDPLLSMGADIQISSNGTLPIHINPVKSLIAVKHELKVASAQVKSAILLAGLHLDETTVVVEKFNTRNHTETMLKLPVKKENGASIISVSKSYYPEKNQYYIPSDISSAAFFMVLGLISENSEIRIKSVLLNESRTGVIEVLKSMGGNISFENIRETSGEKFGDIVVRSSYLRNVVINKELIPNIIDEIPILSVAGIFAEGNFKIENAEELRYKESDRIKSLCDNYKLLGYKVNEFADGFELSGDPTKTSVVIDSKGDHRIAMTFAVLGSQISAGMQIRNFECVAVSNPDFLNQLKKLGS
ncbi:MAG: 3-phosphoshikimate 1-carboxyvinyltransferase [Melioribacteraceae bacterium]|nr:3-phosphoshikimate 1-carboxyvinyltransferase [Melioribacteraceae bacterium]